MNAAAAPPRATIVDLAPERAQWIALDIETGDAPAEAIAAAVEAWKPPSNIKDPEKIEARRIEAEAKRTERAALLDASPILCVALQTDEPRRLILSGMDSGADIEGWQVATFASERPMLEALRIVLELYTNPGTVIVGQNCRAFDLPKLRNAYIRHRLTLPRILWPRITDADQTAPVVDISGLFRSFSMEHREDFAVSLDTIARTLGIPRPKSIISGADVPRLHREGKAAEILTYCAIDTATTARAYELMAGLAPDLR